MKVQMCVAGLKAWCTLPFLWVLVSVSPFHELELCPQDIKPAKVAVLSDYFVNNFGSLSLERVWRYIIGCMEMVQSTL